MGEPAGERRKFALTRAFKGGFTLGATVCFLVTVANVPILSIGAPFWAVLIGLAVSIPFMDSTIYEGPIAIALHGADIAYYIGFLVAGILFYAFRLIAARNRQVNAETPN